MSKTTNNWKSSFAAMRDRFGSNGNEPEEFYPFVNHSVGSSSTFPRPKSESKMYNPHYFESDSPSNSSSLLCNAVKKSTEAAQRQSRKTDLGTFWMNTVNTATNQTRVPTVQRLTAAEHLEQLHEPVEDQYHPIEDNNPNLYSYKHSQLDSVAVRRNTYLRETCRSQSPSPQILGQDRNYDQRSKNNVPSFDSMATMYSRGADTIMRNGCGRFPTTQDTPQNLKPMLQKRNNLAIDNQTLAISGMNDNKFGSERSPSPDTLSDISQNSLLFLPHPRPKHNLHVQLINAGVRSASKATAGYGSSSPNFPSPNYNSVAMRISALEKQPGMPKYLSLAGTANSTPSTMSPQSTVFRTKPVIHLNKNGFEKKDDDSRSYKQALKQKPNETVIVTGGKSRIDDDRQTDIDNICNSLSEHRKTASKFASNNGQKQLIKNELRYNAEEMLPKKELTHYNGASIVNNKPKINGDVENIMVQTQNGGISYNGSQTNAKDVTVPKFGLSNDIKKATEKKEKILTNFHNILPCPTTSTYKPSRVKTSIAGKLANIKRFHYPLGVPISANVNAAVCERVRNYFGAGNVDVSRFGHICELINFPIYAKRAVYEACCRLNDLSFSSNNTSVGVQNENYFDAGINKQQEGSPMINFSQFAAYWNKMTAIAHDEAARFVFTLASARLPDSDCNKSANNPAYCPTNFLVAADFMPIMMDIIESHPGLHFLKASPQFHSRYCEVTMRLLEEVSDINKVTDFFSYEHFYVTYCKFWELDSDHDMIISRDDMREHGGGALTDRIIDRIFSAAVIRTSPSERVQRGSGPITQHPIETIGFEDFVAFLLAEEDKRHPTSIEYWFRCIDLDGDGRISLYEMEYFYSKVEEKLLAKNMETLNLTDVICNLLDSICPAQANWVTRSDLKRSGQAHRFFNTFVNYVKYLDQESSEGERASVKAAGDREMSDWETFCAIEYELLMIDTETNGNAIDVSLDDEEHQEVI